MKEKGKIEPGVDELLKKRTEEEEIHRGQKTHTRGTQILTVTRE